MVRACCEPIAGDKRVAKSKEKKPRPAGVPAAGKRRKARIIFALAGVLVAASAGGGYFAFRTAFAGVRTVDAAPAEIPVPMPVAAVASAFQTKPGDYQIVSVFGDEAILSSGDNLLRVKVGSTAAGLGTITAIESTDNGGGSVAGTQATLRTL